MMKINLISVFILTEHYTMAANTMSTDERIVRIIEQNRINELKPFIHNLSRSLAYTSIGISTCVEPMLLIVNLGRVEMLNMAHSAGVLKDVREDIINHCISIAYSKKSNPKYASIYSTLRACSPTWKPDDSTYCGDIAPSSKPKSFDLDTPEGYKAWMEDYPNRCAQERAERDAREKYCKEHRITTYDENGRVEYWGGR
jgi:hypothetical protein